MKKIGKKHYIIGISLLLAGLFVSSCQRLGNAADDDIPQEELTDIILNVKNLSTQQTISYDYNVGAMNDPEIQLENGESYEVDIVFRNGNEEVTSEILEAKDEHFLLFDFPKSNIQLTRLDGPEGTRTDGKKLGLKTKWDIIEVKKSTDPVLVLTLIHDAASVDEGLHGTTWGNVTGGETDAEAIYRLNN